MSENQVLLKVDNLVKHFPIMAGVFQRQVGVVHAVDGISFEIRSGETFGLVGESGCGKSTAGRTILQLYRPTAGHVYFDDTDLVKLKGEDLRRMRQRMQMIFQDPYASLNPRMTIREIVGEPLVVHDIAKSKQIDERVDQLLDLVRLNPGFASRYPHEFSGGQRQRIGIARALALNPEFIVCDEPISALDVSIQAQVINLLEDLQAQAGPDLPVHRPRPVDGAAYQRPGGGDVPGNPGGAGQPRRAIRAPAAPLYPGAALGSAGAGPICRRKTQADHPGRRRAQPGEPAVRLPFPHPLPAGGENLRRTGARLA